jgi:hypothetical protein
VSGCSVGFSFCFRDRSSREQIRAIKCDEHANAGRCTLTAQLACISSVYTLILIYTNLAFFPEDKRFFEQMSQINYVSPMATFDVSDIFASGYVSPR